MRDQLQRLVSEARSPWTTIQIIPFDAGAFPSMAGSFGAFTFPEEGDRDIAFAITVAGVLYLERHEDVKATNLTFDHLRAVALSQDDSVALISAIAEEYDTR